MAEGLAHVHQKNGHAVMGTVNLGARGGARQEKHEVRVLGPGRPHLLAVDHIAVAITHRDRANAAGIGAAGGFGHAEGLKAQRAGGDLRQDRRFLRGASMPEDRAHGVHLGVTGGAVAPAFLDLFQDRAGGRQAEAAAAEFLGNERGQEPGVGQRANERLRIAPVRVEPPPVVALKIVTKSPNRVTNVLKCFRHGSFPVKSSQGAF